MANIFAKIYAQPWQVTESRSFTEEEKQQVVSNKVVDSQYGLSVCFIMKSGGMAFIPLSNTSELESGDSVDLNKAKILTLSKAGEEDILRVQD